MKLIEKIKILNKKEYDFDNWSKFIMIMSIVVFSATFGFIYEELFYRIDLGYFVKRGTTIGPWIPIYGVGGLFIVVFTSKYKKNWKKVFLFSCIITGILEFLTGYILFHFFNTRLWNYNVEIWNFGNVGGYICLRSIVFFGISSLMLTYLAIPILKYLYKEILKEKYTVCTIILGLLFIFDCLYTNLILKNFMR